MMKKYLVILLSLVVSNNAAHAMTANEQLNAMKNIFIKEFNQIDKNKDGRLSQEEYLEYQFENFRNNILTSSGFTSEKTESTAASDDIIFTEDGKNAELESVPEALKAMAEYDIDLYEAPPEDAPVIEEKTEETLTVTEKKEEPKTDIDLSVSEDDSLKSLLEEMEEETPKLQDSATPVVEEISTETTETTLVPKDKDAQINMMLQTIKQTLPKKIDAITSWTDIEYKDSTISYIYKADIDTSKFTETEKASLELNIKNDACVKAYADMCPKVKPMFIDDGINVQIRYFDSNNTELSSCEFNKETCSD